MLGGQSFELHISRSLDGTLQLRCGQHEFSADFTDPRAWRGRKHGAVEVEGLQEILAPMPGKVVRVLAAVGDAVEAGQGLLVVEAMKMQNEIRSPKSGTVERVLAREGQPVNAREVLCVVAYVSRHLTNCSWRAEWRVQNSGTRDFFSARWIAAAWWFWPRLVICPPTR